MCSPLETSKGVNLNDTHPSINQFSSSTANIVMQRHKSCPPSGLATGFPLRPLRGRSFDDLPKAVSRTLSMDSLSSAALENSPSSRIVKTCKNCSYSFRTRTMMSFDVDFCSKDCETCFTYFPKAAIPPPTADTIRQSIFEFQKQLLQKDKSRSSPAEQDSDAALPIVPDNQLHDPKNCYPEYRIHNGCNQKLFEEPSIGMIISVEEPLPGQKEEDQKTTKSSSHSSDGSADLLKERSKCPDTYFGFLKSRKPFLPFFF
jgi:hypothetical protein